MWQLIAGVVFSEVVLILACVALDTLIAYYLDEQ